MSINDDYYVEMHATKSYGNFKSVMHIVHSIYLHKAVLALQWLDNNNNRTYKIEENDKTEKSLLSFEYMILTENKDHFMFICSNIHGKSVLCCVPFHDQLHF